jgi:hypothetical protein
VIFFNFCDFFIEVSAYVESELVIMLGRVTKIMCVEIAVVSMAYCIVRKFTI